MTRILLAALAAVLVAAAVAWFLVAHSRNQAHIAAAADERALGMQAYDAAHYDEALTHFRKAHEFDPGASPAPPAEFLRCIDVPNVAPGIDTPANRKAAHDAIAKLLEELASAPQSANCMTAIADIEFAIGHMEPSMTWARRALEADPQAPEGYYDAGRVALARANQNAAQALSAAGLSDDLKGNRKAPRQVMNAIKTQNSDLVEEAMRYLFAAVSHRPNYVEALDATGTVYLRKADLDRDDPEALRQDLNAAYEWKQKADDARKVRDKPSQP